MPKQISVFCASCHTSTLDNFFIQYHYGAASFVAKASLKKAPIVGYMMMALGTLFINRAGTEKEKDEIIKEII